MACLPAPLYKVPVGDWFCPNCSTSGATGETISNATFLCLSGILCDEIHKSTSTPVGLTPDDPSTLQEAFAAVDHEDWKEAITSEVISLLEKGTFIVMDKKEVPPAKPIIKAKWIFKRKVDAFGNFLKHKARLVAKGFLQTFGVDYYDKFSPVTKLSTLRVLLSHAAVYDLELRHVDVCTAFLNGVLDEEVYLAIPEGLESLYPSKCFRLKKAIYGLKQAPRVWWLNLSTLLVKHGFTCTFADVCLFRKPGHDGLVYCLVYVDDILFAGSVADVQNAVNIILDNYEATDLGEAKSFLGMAISRDRPNRTITLSQQSFVEQLSKKFNFEPDYPNKKVTIPVSTNDPIPNQRLNEENASLFASLVGSLLYLANCTRPDISFAVGALARHLRAPYDCHKQYAKNLLKYCINTKHYGLVYGPNAGDSFTTDLVGYSDSSYGSNYLAVPGQVVNRRAVSGFVFLSNGTPVAWQSKRQHVMSRSTDDAEFIGLATTASTGLWLRKLYGEMTGVFHPLLIYGDNEASLLHVKEPASINRSKHIDICYQFVLDRALRNDLRFEYIDSKSNAADIFTKPLLQHPFSILREKVGVVPII